jgi:hypothetical protein
MKPSNSPWMNVSIFGRKHVKFYPCVGSPSPMIVGFSAFLKIHRKTKALRPGPTTQSTPCPYVYTLLYPLITLMKKGPIVMNTTIINTIIHVPSDPSHVCGNFRIKNLFLTSGSVTQSVNKSEIGWWHQLYLRYSHKIWKRNHHPPRHQSRAHGLLSPCMV